MYSNISLTAYIHFCISFAMITGKRSILPNCRNAPRSVITFLLYQPPSCESMNGTVADYHKCRFIGRSKHFSFYRKTTITLPPVYKICRQICRQPFPTGVCQLQEKQQIYFSTSNYHCISRKQFFYSSVFYFISLPLHLSRRHPPPNVLDFLQAFPFYFSFPFPIQPAVYISPIAYNLTHIHSLYFPASTFLQQNSTIFIGSLIAPGGLPWQAFFPSLLDQSVSAPKNHRRAIS